MRSCYTRELSFFSSSRPCIAYHRFTPSCLPFVPGGVMLYWRAHVLLFLEVLGNFDPHWFFYPRSMLLLTRLLCLSWSDAVNFVMLELVFYSFLSLPATSTNGCCYVFGSWFCFMRPRCPSLVSCVCSNLMRSNGMLEFSLYSFLNPPVTMTPSGCCLFTSLFASHLQVAAVSLLVSAVVSRGHLLDEMTVRASLRSLPQN